MRVRETWPTLAASPSSMRSSGFLPPGVRLIDRSHSSMPPRHGRVLEDAHDALPEPGRTGILHHSLLMLTLNLMLRVSGIGLTPETTPSGPRFRGCLDPFGMGPA